MHAARRVTADPHGLFAFLDLDLRDAGLLEQLDELLDLANVHRGIPLMISDLSALMFSRASLRRAASWCAAARSASS